MPEYKKKRYVKITSFQTLRRGNWKIKFSTTDFDTIMVWCQSTLNDENTFIKFFSDESDAIAFIDFLIEQDFFQIGQ